MAENLNKPVRVSNDLWVPAVALGYADANGNYVASTSAAPMPVSSAPASLAGATWDGSAKDMTGYSSVTIWCSVAPSVAYAIEASDQNSGFIAQTAGYNNASGVGTTASISAVGRYILPGNCWLRLTGGTGGTFRVAGSN